MRFSLKYRIAVIIFVLEAIMMGVVLWQTLGHSEKATREQFASNDRAILEIMSGISRIALLTDEYADLQLYLENLLDTSRVNQVLLIDSRGLVVASSRPEVIGKFPDAFPGHSEQSALDNAREFWVSNEIRNDAGLLGILAFELTNNALKKATIETRNLGVIIAIAGMLIIAIIGLVVGVLLTRRLATVTSTANHFAHGELNARTGMRGDDEIGELGLTFDKMAENLQTTRDESEFLIKRLEDLVDQLSVKNDQLERFTYTVSHDLKSPLVTVRGFVGMLQKDISDGNDEAVKRDIEYIDSATGTMAQLLEDLLKLARIGHVMNEPQIVALSDVFEETLKVLCGQITEQEAQVNIQPNMPLIFVDRQRLFEVAQNLLENAMKFANPDGPVTISVSATREGDKVICRVEDNGIGIDLQYHEQIFGLFNRLDQSIDGTGIGLSLVKSIIEAHKGSISVESEGAGRGSTFCFSLPVPFDLGTASTTVNP